MIFDPSRITCFPTHDTGIESHRPSRIEPLGLNKSEVIRFKGKKPVGTAWEDDVGVDTKDNVTDWYVKEIFVKEVKFVPEAIKNFVRDFLHDAIDREFTRRMIGVYDVPELDRRGFGEVLMEPSGLIGPMSFTAT